MVDPAATWHSHEKVTEYVDRVGRLAPRLAGEAELLEALPASVGRVLDLGCGDGRLAALVLEARPSAVEAVGLDNSAPMLERAVERFAGDGRVTIRRHDLGQPLPDDLGRFDAVVSGFAIHHLTDERKRDLFAEIAAHHLGPGGVFANLEVVPNATPALEAEFHRRIGREGGDPEDLCAPVEDQLGWLRAAGLDDVDCYWKWRGFALLVGRAATGS